MRKQELRQLRMQGLLIGGLFVLCVIGATVVSTQRRFAEKYLVEKYSSLPKDLRPWAEAAARGSLDIERWRELDQDQRRALFEEWMGRADSSEKTPAALVTADPVVYIRRAEQTLVCGSAAQRAKALRFLLLARSNESLPMLQNVRSWAARRRLDGFVDRIDQTVAALRKRDS